MSVLRHENLNLVVSGNGLLQSHVTQEALDLTGKQNPNVLVVCSPKSSQEEIETFLGKATLHFADNHGLSITNLHDFNVPPSPQEAEDKLSAADMVWTTGGDTLQAMDFWQMHGIDRHIREAAERGTVMSGGSAGMLVWFERGHSDSMSYRVAEDEHWDYMFVRGLGYLAATGCPHYDSKTAGARMRREDFAEKFAADGTLPPLGIAITNRAALAIHGQDYRVVASPNNSRPSEVHILQKTQSGIETDLLPILSDYRPLEV